MSIRFAIKNVDENPQKEGNIIVRYTGSAEPFTHSSEREARPIGLDEKGNTKIVFNTGLDEKQVQFFDWYNDDEKESASKEIKDLRPLISAFYRGDKMVAESNVYFWKQPSVNMITVTNETKDIFFDTKNAPHALLYLGIISGAFIDTIAPTKEWAEKHQLYHYIALEQDDDFISDDRVTKSEAHGALTLLRKEATPEVLFILAWCMQYDTNAYGAYLRSTPTKELVNYHIKYIDGELNLKKKRNTPKVFLEYVEKWNSAKLRPLLITEAYIKAGEYYNFLVKRDKKLETRDGLALGNTVNEAIDTLIKGKNTEEYEKLRDLVEAKWNE